MSSYDTINTLISQTIEEVGDLETISASSIALLVRQKIATGPLDPLIEYASLEHFKQMSRAALARRFNPADNDNEPDQYDMFDGKLQRRYPIPHRDGEGPSYKLLEHLTDIELRWNIRALQRSAYSRLEHARALEAWSETRKIAA